MKVSVLGDNLNKALALASRVVTTRAQLPVLANVLLKATKEGLEILATDLEVGVRIRVGAKVEEEGELSVVARTLAEYVATIGSGVVEMSSQNESLKLKAGKSVATLPGIEAGEFPSIPGLKGKADLEVEVEKLIKAVDQVGFAAAKDEARPIFTGMLWKFAEKKITLAATDGYRLSVNEVVVEKVSDKEIKQLVLPVRVLAELTKSVKEEKSVSILVDLEKQQVVFKAGEVEWVSRLLAGDFPPYEQILPSGWTTRVVFDRLALTEAVKRAVIFARESANIVKLSIDASKLTVSANSASVGGGETEVEVEQEGEPLMVAFNGRYLLDYLAAVEAEELVFESEGPLKAGLFRIAGEKLTHVIMPVRVQN